MSARRKMETIEEIMERLWRQLAADLQRLRHPTRCASCGGTVAATKQRRKLALLGARLADLVEKGAFR